MADTQVCPYGDDNKMHMVGHTNKCITLNIWKFIFQFNRPSFYHFPCLIQSHFTIKRLTEQTSTILGADRNEIRPSLRIIVPPQPNGAAVMNSRVKYHVVYSSVFIAVAGAESRRGEPVCSPCPHTHGLWHRAGVWGTRADTQVCPYGLAPCMFVQPSVGANLCVRPARIPLRVLLNKNNSCLRRHSKR